MHLTQRSLILAALAGALQIGALWLELPALGRLALLVLLLLLAGLLVEALTRGRRRPQVAVTAPATELGRPAEIRVQLTNACRELQPVEYLPSLPAACRGDTQPRAVQVPPGATMIDAYPLFPERLGRLPVPALLARVQGRYGLAWWRTAFATGAELTVRPGFLSDDERRRATAGGGTTVLVKPGSGTELLQLRPFRSGDPPRAIDWRATARTGALVSRDYGQEEHLEIILAVDAGRYSGLGLDGLDRLGQYAHVAARFAERAVLAQDRVGLVVYAQRVLAARPPARGAGALHAIRELLTDVRAAEEESDVVAAALEIRRLARVRSLVVLFSDLDDPRGSGALARALALLRPQHVVLVAGLASAAVTELSRRLPRRRAQAYLGLAADLRTDNLHDTLAQLRLQAVPAVLAPPAGYERAVLAAYDALRQRRRI